MRGADVYYGERAENYEASRSVKPKWQVEQAAVERFLTDGPVLDVPVGTGRFIPIYRAKGLEFTGIDISSDMLGQTRSKYPDANIFRGSVFYLPFGEREFETAVCVRLLEWFPIERAALIIEHLRRAAHTLILTITHGEEGEPEAFTYDYGKFLSVIDGLFIVDRQVTATVRGMVSEVFKLRPAQWSDVLAQFERETDIQRLADKHAGFFGLHVIPVTEQTVSIRAEYWHGDKINEAVGALAEHRFITSEKPRRDDLPMTAIERDGRTLIIDGRKRANQWMQKSGPHPVLVMRPL